MVAELLPPEPDGRLPPGRAPLAGVRHRARPAPRSLGPGRSGYTVAAPPTDIDGEPADRSPAASPVRRRLRPADAVTDRLARPPRPSAGRPPPPADPTSSTARSDHHDRTVTRAAAVSASAPAPAAPASPAPPSSAPVLGARSARPAPRPRRRPAGGRATRKKQVHLVGTDGWVSMPADAPADPPFFPDSLAPSAFNTYVFGFRDVTGHDARRRWRPSAARPRSARRCSSFDEEDDVYHHADQPRPAAAARPLRRAHAALARLRQRDPAVRRRARAVAGRAGRAATSPTSTGPTTPARTCTTATSRTWSTCRWA